MASPKTSVPIIKPSKEHLDHTKKEIIFWEEGNPRCVVNLLRNAPQLREKILNIPPNFLAMSDHELEKFTDPTPVDQELRLSFWDEYTLAIDNDTPMRAAGIYSNVCSKEFFNAYVASDPKRLAYILRPPREYMLRMRSLLENTLKRFEEIVQKPLEETKYISQGKDKPPKEVKILNTKLIAEMIKIFSIVDNRVKGAVTQRVVIDQTSKNLNMNVNQNYEPPKTIEEIEKELKKIKGEIHTLDVPRHQPDEEILINGFRDEREITEIPTSGSEEEGT